MASIPQIRDRLKEVFSPEQADVLAHAVIEAHVTKRSSSAPPTPPDPGVHRHVGR